MNNELLNDVLADGDSLRERTCDAGLRAMRGRRLESRARIGAALFLAPLLMAVTLSFLHRPAPARSSKPVVAQVETIPGTDIRLINDQQLLDMFPGRPVALVGPSGHQQLIFFETR